MAITREKVLKRREKLNKQKIKHHEKIKAIQEQMKAMQKEIQQAEKQEQEEKFKIIGRILFERFGSKEWLAKEITPFLKKNEKDLFQTGE